MPVEITIPRLGWSMEEGTFGEWLKKPGEVIQRGEMIFVLEGEKAAHEIESFDTGILHIPEGAPQSGDTVLVGQVIGYLLAEGESPPASLPSIEGAPAEFSPPPVEIGHRRPAGPAARRLARRLRINLDSVETPDPTGRVLYEDVERTQNAMSALPLESRLKMRASPRARRRATELGVDWSQATGTGRGGRIRERDVLAYASRLRCQPGDLIPAAAGILKSISQIRRVTVTRMIAGLHQAAPVTLTTKVDAAALVAFREMLKTEASGAGAPGYNDILLKIVAAALPECPLLNACWQETGVYVYDQINLGLAIDTEQGIVVPVIRKTNLLSLAEIADRSRTLIEQARAGTLSQNQLQGGTFTITNLGMYDVDFFTPILNLPQSAILGIGRIVREPVVREGTVVAGETLGLSLTFDHRVIDGAPAARWMQYLSHLIHNLTDTDVL